jgi:hypothetical protein
MTKEHILPKFLYRQFPTQKLGYNARADKFLTWEPQVRDVCAACNNGFLSSLDGYARRFLTSLHCQRTYRSDTEISFQYDHNLLLRWILKVSYNASRALSETPGLLKQCVPFIRDGEAAHPPIAFLAVEVVRDTIIQPEMREFLPEVARTWSHIPARMFRAGPGILVAPSRSDRLPENILRFVAINAWYFTVCIVPAEVGRQPRRRLGTSFKAHIRDAVMLSPSNNEVRVRVSKRTGMDAYEFQAKRVANQWRKYAETAFPSGPSKTP